MAIFTLTPEQKKLLPVFRDEWLQVGLNTETINKEKAELAVKNLYKAAGMKEPIVMFFPSPAMCLLARSLILNNFPKSTRKLRENNFPNARSKAVLRLSSQLITSLGFDFNSQVEMKLISYIHKRTVQATHPQLSTQFEHNLKSQLLSRFRDKLKSSLDSEAGGWLGGFLYTYLYSELSTKLAITLSSEFEHNLHSHLSSALGSKDFYQAFWLMGGWDSYWIAFYKFAEKIGVKYKCANHFNAYVDYAKHCGIMYPYEEIAFVSDRPESFKFDDRKRLHCETDLALKFRDGYGVAAWHGVRVPNDWILTGSLDAKTALTWENMEERRAACEIIGWDKILDELDARTIDKHENKYIGELVVVNIPDVGEEKFLRYECGTGRRFASPVSPVNTTALQAQSELRNLPEQIIEISTVRT